MKFILAQIFGLVALVLICIGYFFKKRSYFLWIQVFANFFYASAFIIVSAYVAGIITFISIIRCLYLYIAEKKLFKYIYQNLTIFIILYVLTTVFFWTSWLDIIPLITSILYTFGISIKNLQLGKYVLIIPNIILVVYNIITTTYTSAILDFIEVIVIIIAIITNIQKNKITPEIKSS